jgi:hypothetical protein
LLAPTKELLDDHRKRKGEWSTYERELLALMRERSIESRSSAVEFAAPTALLCSEATAERCHRRLVCDYPAEHWPEVRAAHL